MQLSLVERPNQITAPAQTAEPLVSVILPVFNEARHIATCLRSLLGQSGVTSEIIVIDDGSTDQTPAIVRELAARYPQLRLITQQRKGPGAARNLGAQLARGTYLAFCDGDMAFAPMYLAALIAPIECGEAIGTFSKEEYVANWSNVWARCWNINDGMADNRRHPDDWPDRHAVFRAIRRDQFLQAQGFAVEGAGDDSTITRKTGWLAHAAPGAICYHYNPDSLSEAFRQARWYARGRRVPASWANLLRSTPPVSFARSLRRAIKYRLPQFILLRLVMDLGVFSGLVEKQLRGAGAALMRQNRPDRRLRH